MCSIRVYDSLAVVYILQVYYVERRAEVAPEKWKCLVSTYTFSIYIWYPVGVSAIHSLSLVGPFGGDARARLVSSLNS